MPAICNSVIAPPDQVRGRLPVTGSGAGPVMVIAAGKAPLLQRGQVAGCEAPAVLAPDVSTANTMATIKSAGTSPSRWP